MTAPFVGKSGSGADLRRQKEEVIAVHILNVSYLVSTTGQKLQFFGAHPSWFRIVLDFQTKICKDSKESPSPPLPESLMLALTFPGCMYQQVPTLEQGALLLALLHALFGFPFPP